MITLPFVANSWHPVINTNLTQPPKQFSGLGLGISHRLHIAIDYNKLREKSAGLLRTIPVCLGQYLKPDPGHDKIRIA